mgnify:CR=1 FL=1
MNEIDKIKERYSERVRSGKNVWYSRHMLLNELYRKEKDDCIRKLFRKIQFTNFSEIKVLEVGCGNGSNLQKLIESGFSSANLYGNELLDERLQQARTTLPSDVHLYPGDACALPFESHSFDIVYQSTVFSSILDQEFRQSLASRMWDWVRPGGGILWYYFIYNNPWNPDVRGVSVKQVKSLFPHGRLIYYRLTLAPPLARFVTTIHPVLYSIFNVFPLLRTHISVGYRNLADCIL